MIPLTEARSKLKDLAQSPIPSVIADKGKPIGVIMGYEQFRQIKQDLKAQHEFELSRRAKAVLSEDFSEYEEGLD